MDKSKAFVGEHAPMIKLATDAPHGITQNGLPLRKDRKYTGRIALAGSAGAKIEVSLIWGEGKDQRQTIIIDSLKDQYVKFPLAFTAAGDTDDGRLTITGTGSGSFWIGVVSLMPADNVKGFRADMVALLKDLDQGVYRWPGGNFVSGYDWRDGVGDIDKRPPRYDYAWNTVEYNDVGTDEFLTMCGLLGIDPYICVNAGFGDAFSAAQWVEYANGSADTPMGKLRAANGHPEPYRVSWWGIGNEVYGEWQLGHIYIDQYVLKHNAMAHAMKAVDPTIKIIASGATPFETSTTARHHRKPLPATLPYAYGSKQDWSYNLLEKCADNIDFLAEHVYPFGESEFDAAKQEWVPGNASLVDRVRKTPNRIEAAAEAMAEYKKRLPDQLKNRNITLAIDEWTGGGGGGPGRGDFSRTLAAAEGLHEMFRHSDVITMGAYTAFSANLSTTGAEACYSPTGLAFGLYRHHFGTIPLAVTGNAPQHELKGTVGVDKPVTTSGSATYPLDVAAALSPDHKLLTVAVVNPTESAQSIAVSFSQITPTEPARKWQIAPRDLQARNIPGQEPAVKTIETPLDKVPTRLDVPPLSVTMYEFGVK
jgi:alpha-N-arabinofuranosidase